MSRSKRLPKFDKVAAVKSNARDRVGTPKATQIITPKVKRKPKYKKDWTKVNEDTNDGEN